MGLGVACGGAKPRLSVIPFVDPALVQPPQEGLRLHPVLFIRPVALDAGPAGFEKCVRLDRFAGDDDLAADPPQSGPKPDAKLVLADIGQPGFVEGAPGSEPLSMALDGFLVDHQALLRPAIPAIRIVDVHKRVADAVTPSLTVIFHRKIMALRDRIDKSWPSTATDNW